MPIKRQATRPVDRVVYPFSFCARSWQAMNTIRERVEALTGVTYSHSVISRALALQAEQPSTSHQEQEILELCRKCASKRKKKESSQ